ncbi:MAG: glycosyltransferase family 2 protein, partial [Bacteroidota bacterium]|nr:glycosyltransferase family 2 protein [Bacteroidota bacterium]
PFPLISVVITTYNYASYLPRAIDSVRQQTYSNIEIIVIDDGSTDDTKSVINENPFVRYYYQENNGISSARNAGIRQAKGKYLLFLDADDWLEPDAIENNFEVIRDKPQIAFVSGNYYLLHVESGRIENVAVSVNKSHYARLLESNYIGMLGAVLFQKWVLEEVQFDERLQACEDYDLYLTIARKYPLIHHRKFIATYCFHNYSLSHNYQAMIDSISAVMNKQAPYVKTRIERKAYAKGLLQWKEYFSLLVERSVNKDFSKSTKQIIQ